MTTLSVLTSACLLLADSAHAACQVDTKPVSFGVIDVANRNDSNGEIVLNCSVSTSFAVGLSSDGAPNERSMIGPNGGRLAYDLYTDSTRAARWGDGGGGSEVTGSSDGESASRFTIYGRVPSQKPVPPGSYSDVLTVSVAFF